MKKGKIRTILFRSQFTNGSSETRYIPHLNLVFGIEHCDDGEPVGQVREAISKEIAEHEELVKKLAKEKDSSTIARIEFLTESDFKIIFKNVVEFVRKIYGEGDVPRYILKKVFTDEEISIYFGEEESSDSPLSIIKQRLARGEISIEEYENLKIALEG